MESFGIRLQDTAYWERRRWSILHLILFGLAPIDLDVQLSLCSLSDINSGDSLGRTPLHWAAARGDYQATKSLLNAGASPTARETRNQMPIQLCCMTGTAEVLELLIVAAALSEGYKATSWSERNPGLRPRLYSWTLDDRKEYQGRSPIHLAARMDHLAKIQLLVLHGADIESLDKRGRTPLLLAIYWNSHDTIAWLLGERVSTDAVTTEKMTILHYAARFGDIRTLNLLCKGRITVADVDQKDENGHTAQATYENLRPASLTEDTSLMSQSRETFQTLLENAAEYSIVEVDDTESDDGSSTAEFFDAASEL